MFVIAKVILSEFLWGIPHIFLNTIYLHSHYVTIIHYDDISVSSGKYSFRSNRGTSTELWMIGIGMRWNETQFS